MIKAAIVTLCLAGSAFGQAGWIVDVVYPPGQTSVNRESPSCTIRVSASFPREYWAFAASLFEVAAREPMWSDLRRGLGGWLGRTGVINGPVVEDIALGQSYFTIPPYPFNPISVWEATWTAERFHPRSVPVETRTSRFEVYIASTSPATRSLIPGFVEGRAEVAVTPAPATILSLAGLAGASRRRSPASARV